jgi:predicted ester cyclase
LAGYQAMLENDFQQIPDLWFKSELVVCEPPTIAAASSSIARRRAAFSTCLLMAAPCRSLKHVFYEFEASRIKRVWSVIDKTAIEAHLS